MRKPGPARILANLLLIGIVALAAGERAEAELRIVGPEEVRQQYLVERGDRTFLRVDGREWELVTDPASSLVSQLGDGRFHPMNLKMVQAAVREVHPFTLPSDGVLLVLPYPRRQIVESSCEGSLVFLSPGIREVSPEHVHSTVVHEVGHIVQHTLLPVGSEAWARYLEKRALSRDPRFHARAIHRDRPSEIFAEDYRHLFGGDLATFSNSIENPDLALPEEIPGLREWMRRVVQRSRLALTEAPPEPTSTPNPFDSRTASMLRIRFDAPGGTGPSLVADVVDVTGRRVNVLDGAVTRPEEVTFTWDGRDRDGRQVASGIYLVRWRERPEAGSARVHVLR